MRAVSVVLIVAACCGALAAKEKTRTSGKEGNALDEFVREAQNRAKETQTGTPGSLYRSTSHLSDLTRDLRATHVDDTITILVAETASAVSSAASTSQRKSSASSSIGKLLGVTKATGPLANLADVTGSQQMQGQGSTSRQTTVSTTLSARVIGTLPNGLLVIEGTKTIAVNSENQTVTIRGIARQADIALGNIVRSDHLTDMEVRVNGKGVVGDATRRPFILYRLLLGILPF